MTNIKHGPQTIGGSSQGPSVDRAGSPVIDPTENVKDIINAAVQRLDDLRTESIDTRDREITHVKDLMGLRASYTEKLLDQQAENIERLQIAEAKRIDAIRAVDVNAVSVASERAAAQANVLANQVTTTADTLRALVVATAAQQAQSLSQLITPLTDRIASLEKSAYEGVGKGRVQDPMMAELLIEMKQVRSNASTSSGSGEGMTKMIGWVVGGMMFLIALATFIVPHLK